MSKFKYAVVGDDGIDSPMAEDELHKIFHHFVGERPDIEPAFNKAINAYTTNKIIEELENIMYVDWGEDLNDLVDNSVDDYIRDRIKALNHRKDEHGDSE